MKRGQPAEFSRGGQSRAEGAAAAAMALSTWPDERSCEQSVPKDCTQNLVGLMGAMGKD